MIVRLAIVCLIFAAFAAGFGALVSKNPEFTKFVSATANNRCAFNLPCKPPKL